MQTTTYWTCSEEGDTSRFGLTFDVSTTQNSLAQHIPHYPISVLASAYGVVILRDRHDLSLDLLSTVSFTRPPSCPTDMGHAALQAEVHKDYLANIDYSKAILWGSHNDDV